jgi:adenylosuccinate synthase
MEMNRIIVGMQWGDEGKGKIVDYLGQDAKISIRFNGGDNAGHTVIDESGRKHIARLFPGSSLLPGMTSIIGRGCVADPETLIEEIKVIKEINPTAVLIIDPKVKIIFQQHRDQDKGRSEGVLPTSTGRGIGPIYADKMRRSAFCFGDLLDDSSGSPIYQGVEWQLWREELRPYIKYGILGLLDVQKNGLMFCGAHGTMLDIDYGSYPYTTSSTCIAAGAVTGGGARMSLIDEIVGVAKAYGTRVGQGPFPTEMESELGDRIREKGHEFGSVTGLPRRVGWLDLPVLRHAIRANEITSIALTRLDILSGIEHLKIGSEYWVENENNPIGLRYGNIYKNIPEKVSSFSKAKPLYYQLIGWKEDISGCRKYKDLPEAAKRYIELIEDDLKIPIKWIGVGPRRDQIIDRGYNDQCKLSEMPRMPDRTLGEREKSAFGVCR